MSRTDPISPLTIIAIFAGIIEASALASLPFLSERSQSIYTWFLVAFPFFLTVLFFLTLNFNYRSLYSPSEEKSAAELSPAPAESQEDSIGAQPPAITNGADIATQQAGPPSPRTSSVLNSSVVGDVMILTVSGTDARKVIAAHILRTAVQEHRKERHWVINNLDSQTRITLSVRPLPTAPEKVGA
ncbi:hypothetical protein ACYU03_06170 [Pseudomonas sp. X10]